MDYARGIDINHYHSPTDWPAVFGSGISFVGIKATQNIGYVDPKLDEHRARANEHASCVLLYHFAGPQPSAESQADNFLEAIGGELVPHELPVLDLERGSESNGPMPFGTRAEVFDKAQRWIEHVEAALEVRPLLYCRGLWIDCGDPYLPWARTVDLWVPRYRAPELGPGPLPAPWAADNRWKFWQWSDGTTPPATTPGVGACDQDFFNGNVEDLVAYVAKAGRGAPSP